MLTKHNTFCRENLEYLADNLIKSALKRNRPEFSIINPFLLIANMGILTRISQFLGKAKENVTILPGIYQIFRKGNWKCNQTQIFTWKTPKIWYFPYINVAKMNYTMGQFGHKIDEFILNLAIHTLRLRNATFDWEGMWFVNKTKKLN